MHKLKATLIVKLITRNMIEIVTYPVGDGPSVVIIGFNPSFLRFLPSEELPLAPAIRGSAEVEDWPPTGPWVSEPPFAPGVDGCACVPAMFADRGDYLATSARLKFVGNVSMQR